MGAFIAPILAYTGHLIAARFVYMIYRISCHQLAYRTWFLFGERAFYPLQLAGIQNAIPYEEISGNPAGNTALAQSFIGSSVAGFKTALCQRDIAIYAGILFAGGTFALARRKLKPISILYWIVLGILPLFFDGVVQWMQNIIPNLTSFSLWESTPLIRTATGVFFGFTTGLFIFPKLEQALWVTKNNHKCKE